MKRTMLRVGLISSLSVFLGAKGGGCGAVSSMDPAPSVAGQWAISYGTMMNVDVTIGGAVYHQSLAASGGTFTVTHQGQPLAFSIDCSRPEVICPSEVWPSSVAIDQRDPTYPHRMWVAIPTQACSSPLVAPKSSECGAGTLNPDCKPVCTGQVTTTTADAFGVIADDGATFDLLLGGGLVTNGVNCALLGVSVAHAQLKSTGTPMTSDWAAQSMESGTVKTGYAGGCLWAGDPTMSGQLQALVVGASVEISTSFTGTRASR
jgi:hypothetical protein